MQALQHVTNMAKLCNLSLTGASPVLNCCLNISIAL